MTQQLVMAHDLNLYHSSSMIKSNKFTLSLNNQNQISSIDTNIKPKTYEYIMSSLGEIDTALFSKLSTIDNKIIKMLYFFLIMYYDSIWEF